MHARQRPPGNGNGYRSPIGMGGVGPTSRISPDGAVRGNPMYNSEYRSYGRGFGRGQPKPFQQPPQPPPRRGDVFMEAGRLATEYLVSRGILPQTVLSGKWQNGTIKNLVGNFQGVRPQEGDLQAESRPSALARLGEAAINERGAVGRKRLSDEYNPAELRNFMRGKRRMGTFKGYGSDSNRELGRSTSWSESSGVSPDKDNIDDAFNGYQEEQQVSKESGSGEQKSQSGDIASKSDISSKHSPHEKKDLPVDDVASKASSSSTGVSHPSESDLDPAERPKCMNVATVVTEEVKDNSCDNETEKQGVMKELTAHHCTEDDFESKNGSNLLKLCTFAKVPTRTRSSLTVKASKPGSLSTTKDENTDESGLSLASGASVEARHFNSSLNHAQMLKADPDIIKPELKEEATDLSTAHELGQGKCTRSKSFPDRSFMEQGLNEGATGFGRSNTMDSWKDDKRSMQLIDSGDGSKKAREWVPMVGTQAGNCSYLSDSVQNLKSLVEGKSIPNEEVTIESEHKKLLDISLSTSGVAKPRLVCTEEKQLMSGSFKICDLNLMGASDPQDNHDDRHGLLYPSIPREQKEAGHVDIDLSMSNNSTTPDRLSRRGANGKEVEVIDLEMDCIQDNKALNNPDQKDETLFTGLDSLTSSAQNVNDISGVQDGYGLMISELLGSDMPNCSSVTPGVNSLQNEMGLNNGEGLLGDDDSIYMSLGEIPISFLRGWEQQPSQEYDKPF